MDHDILLTLREIATRSLVDQCSLKKNSCLLYQLLYVGTINRNSGLITELISKQEVTSKNTQQEVLFKFVCIGDIENVKFLISQGIDINITNASNVTALDIACERNNFDMVSFLLGQKIIFNTTSIIDLIPLQAAAIRIGHEDGDLRIIEALLRKYQETSTPLSKSVLLDVDHKLQHGPNYIQEEYKKLVKTILGETIEQQQPTDLLVSDW